MAGADTSTDADDVADYKEEFTEDREVWSSNYDRAAESFRFARLHEHWPEKVRKEREEEGRPCLTIPLLPPILRQVENDARQNKPGMVVSAVDSGADPETAEIIEGLIRQIERSSRADVAYDTAIMHAVTGGFGWLKVNTRYARDDGFEQDIVVEPVLDPFSIIPDPDSSSADSSDWNRAWDVERISKRAFERRFKDAEAISFEDQTRTTSTNPRDMLTIAYRWAREESVRQIVALSPPMMDAPPEAIAEAMKLGLLPESLIVDVAVYTKNKALFDALGMAFVGQPRDVPSYKVTQKCLSGAEVLKTVDWAGRWIPIVPVYGADVTIEGERTLEGMVWAAMDEQRRHNYHMSSATESTALAPKTPFIGRAGQFVTDADKWNTANQKSWPYIEYDVPEGVPDHGPPQRQGYAGVPIGDFQMAMSASDSIKAITGIHNASLGVASNETSGKAIFARQREGDVGSFHYVDNLRRAIRHLGAIILDLIPHTHSTARIIRTLGRDETERDVPVNQEVEVEREGPNGELEKIAKVYDLTSGKYDLDVKSGPSFSTQREEFVALITEIIRSFPQAAPVLLDLVVKNYDLPDADKVVERLEALLPANLKGESPEAQEMKAQIEQLAKLLGQAKAENQALKADKSLESRKVEIDAFEAETGRMKALAPKGVAYDPAEMAALASQSIQMLFDSPDILQAAQGGAPLEQIGQMLAQRMQPQPQEQQQPAQAA